MKLYLYKLFLLLVKWMPVVIAMGILLTNTLAVFEITIEYLYILEIIFGNSISYIIFMYAASYVFQFCNWHRITITYNLIALIFNIIISYLETEYYEDVILLFIHYLIAIIFTGISYYSYKKCKNHESANSSSKSSS